MAKAPKTSAIAANEPARGELIEHPPERPLPLLEEGPASGTPMPLVSAPGDSVEPSGGVGDPRSSEGVADVSLPAARSLPGIGEVVDLQAPSFGSVSPPTATHSWPESQPSRFFALQSR